MGPQVPLNKSHPGPRAEGWGQVTRQAQARVSSAPAPALPAASLRSPHFPGTWERKSPRWEGGRTHV